MKKIKKFKNKYSKFVIFLYVIVTVFLIQLLSFMNLGSTLEYIQHDFLNFLINIALFTLGLLVVLGITNRVKISMSIISILSLILGIATKIKMDFRGVSVGASLNDLFLLGEAKDMAGVVSNDFIIKASIYSLIFIVITVVLIYFAKNKPFKLKTRLSILFGSLILLVLFSLFGSQINSRYIKDQKSGVINTGAIQYFALNSKIKTQIEVPSKGKVDEVSVLYSKELPSLGKKGVKPDIIMIQSESLFDPTVIGMKNFSADPLPFLHQIESESYSYKNSSPVFGGGTTNAEFEVLTGIPAKVLPNQTIVYNTPVNKGTISLGSILSSQGYYSTLMHPGAGGFYNRNAVYKNLGFDRFYALPDMLKMDPAFGVNSRIDTGYPSDGALFDEGWNKVKNSTRPQFMFLVTIQNHVPYSKKMYSGPINIKYTGNNLADPETKTQFNRYLNEIKESDDGLKKLIGNIKKSARPTIVVFYGDHETQMNQDGSFFSELGMSDPSKGQNVVNTQQSITPGFIWSNYLNTKEIFKNSSKMQPCYETPINLLSILDLKYPQYLKTLNGINSDGIQSLNYEYLVKNGNYVTSDESYYKKTMDSYTTIYGDMMNSNKYFEKNPEKFLNKNPYIGPEKLK